MFQVVPVVVSDVRASRHGLIVTKDARRHNDGRLPPTDVRSILLGSLPLSPCGRLAYHSEKPRGSEGGWPPCLGRSCLAWSARLVAGKSIDDVPELGERCRKGVP